MLISCHSVGSFCMLEDITTDHLVVNLELWRHKLDEPHLCHPKFTCFLEDLDVCDDLSDFRGETHK